MTATSQSTRTEPRGIARILPILNLGLKRMFVNLESAVEAYSQSINNGELFT